MRGAARVREFQQLPTESRARLKSRENIAVQASPNMTPDACADVIMKTIASIAPQTSPMGWKTALTGASAVVDSVGFVSLLVSLEQNLGSGIDLASVFLERGSDPEESNPFRTIGTLATFLANHKTA